MADFDRATLKVLQHEGVEFGPDGRPVSGRTGYVNHPDDPGGETNYGITRKIALENGYAGHMRDIPYPKILDIYRRKYWDDLRGDEVPDQEIAEELFDTGVNCGMPTVKRFLQRTLNVLNVKGTKYPDVVVDGVIGPRTIEALNRALTVAPWYRLCILRALDSLQCVRYIELAERNKKFESFVPGWLRVRVGGGEEHGRHSNAAPAAVQR